MRSSARSSHQNAAGRRETRTDGRTNRRKKRKRVEGGTLDSRKHQHTEQGAMLQLDTSYKPYRADLAGATRAVLRLVERHARHSTTALNRQSLSSLSPALLSVVVSPYPTSPSLSTCPLSLHSFARACLSVCLRACVRSFVAHSQSQPRSIFERNAARSTRRERLWRAFLAQETLSHGRRDVLSFPRPFSLGRLSLLLPASPHAPLPVRADHTARRRSFSS